MGTPLLDNEGLARLLGLTDLRDAACEARRDERRPPTIVIHPSPGSDALAAWRRLRALLPRTGRYPVLVPAGAEGLGLDETRARALRIAPLLDLDDDERLHPDGHAGAAEPPSVASPWPDSPCSIAMPPAATMWEAALHVAWRGAAREPDLLAALLRHWERRFGAELVMALPCTLHFSVRRPPAQMNDALTLAAQQRAVARASGGTKDHARALLGADRWSLVAP